MKLCMKPSLNPDINLKTELNSEMFTSLHEIALSTLPECFEFPQKLVLRGSFHQADACFGNSRNKQCGAISLMGVLTSKIKSVLIWTTQDLDGVLVAGMHHYEALTCHSNVNDQEFTGRHYIAVHELPRMPVLGDTVFYIEYAQSLTRIVNVTEYDRAVNDVAMSLDFALQQALRSADTCLLTICANTCADIKESL